ncbi:NAD-dependent epimerase/dehydratase family protein [Streptomyces sp. NPDC047071]|uniref:NAD-dependent epimerase/dehydratase family protein n=1 Tax=Streptomyces sp. NPDC047071 TaxID=3154808 RepID=UPI003454D6DC
MTSSRGGAAGSPAAARVAVVGGCGFIGRNLRAALDAAGVRTCSFTRQRPFMQGDRVHRALLRSHTVFYVAGGVTPARAEREPRLAAQDYWNLQLLLWGLRGTAHRPLVVLASSGGTVYDPDVGAPYREDAPTRPVTAYGRVKLAQERALVGAEWVAPVTLRLANVYGPGQPAGAGFGVVPHWAAAVRAGRALTLIGRARRDYVHVADVCAALLAVHRRADRLRAGPGPTTLNIGSGVPTSLDELHRHFERAAGRALDVRREPARSFDRADVWLDVTAARQEIGWRARIGLVDGLTGTLAAAGAPARMPS